MAAPDPLRCACRDGDLHTVRALVVDGDFANALYREKTGEPGWRAVLRPPYHRNGNSQTLKARECVQSP